MTEQEAISILNKNGFDRSLGEYSRMKSLMIKKNKMSKVSKDIFNAVDYCIKNNMIEVLLK